MSQDLEVTEVLYELVIQGVSTSVQTPDDGMTLLGSLGSTCLGRIDADS